MTIWHVKKLYTTDESFYKVLPYDFVETMKVTLKMKKGLWQIIKFLLNSRWTARGAHLLCEKRNDRMV